MNIPFIGPSYTSRSVNVDAQRSVNLYPEVVESQTGKSVAVLYGTPGLQLFCTFPEGPVRGLWACKGRLFAVSGRFIYEVLSDTSYKQVGYLPTQSGPVSMADNGQQLCIVDGVYGAIYGLVNGNFAPISSADFKGADKVAFLDGYFIFNQPNSGVFYISSLYDGGTIDGLDFASAEGNPDNIVSLLSDHRELWLFGERTTEVWFNSGNVDFPFERISGAFIEHGCAAPHSVAKMDNSVFWLGSDDRGKGTIYRAAGYQPQRISTHAVEDAINSYGDISDAVAYTYHEDGHSFYVLNFTNANTTWVFDAATGMWHERAYTSNGVLTRHRSDNHAFAFNKHFVGDFRNGKLYVSDLNVYSDAGNPITRMRAAPHIHQDLKFLTFHRFQIDMETGVGPVSGLDPKAMLQWSDDGGHSWSNEHWVSVGKIGKYKARAIWRRLGRSRDRVFRVIITDGVKVALIAANAEVTQGTN